MEDIHVCLNLEECPKIMKNFTTHYHNVYYDNLSFHKGLKGFMVHIGNPLVMAFGESIWGGKFINEFHKR
jgi:cyclophilin family peptidyl-prolyl cis-trans isomerase